jgi:hypothetical protein
MDEAAIRAHVRAIDACNQRGGRMLSLVDLIDAETLDLSLGAYLAAAMRSGASLLVGARPGGAGKTAVMCALLNFVPDHMVIRPVDSPAVLREALRDDESSAACYLAHEIGDGFYYAYIWGRDARAFFRLAAEGHTIASNLHADTLEETQEQLCEENGVRRAHVDAITLKIYLRMARTSGWRVRRWVSHVYESDGEQDRLLWTGNRRGAFTRQKPFDSSVVSLDQERQWAGFLTMLRRQDVRTIEDVRHALAQSSTLDRGM